MRVLILGVNGFIGNALTERILDTTDWSVSGLDIGCRPDRPVPRPSALHLPRRGHRDQQGVDRVPDQEVRRRASARRDRDARGVRQEPLERLPARLRGEPAHRQAGGPLRKARSSSLRPPRSTACARTRASTRTPPRSSTGRSASSAGSTPAPSSCSTASSGRTARRKACGSRSFGPSTGSARTWTTSTRPRRAPAAS